MTTHSYKIVIGDLFLVKVIKYYEVYIIYKKYANLFMKYGKEFKETNNIPIDHSISTV